MPRRDPDLLTASSTEIITDEAPAHLRHTVRRGENFWSISQHYYGSGRYYKALWAANGDQVQAPDRLAVGMTIVVPPVVDLDPSLVSAPPAARKPSTASAPQKAWAPAKPETEAAGAIAPASPGAGDAPFR